MFRLGLTRLGYAPFHVQLVATRRCNLACAYCNEYDHHSPPVPREELERRIDKIHELGAWAIEFTGGEPLLHPDIMHLVRYAKRKGFYRVMMISNLYLSNEEVVRSLNEAGLDELQVSVDGVTPNDATVKVIEPLREKLEVLARVAEFRVVMSGVVGSAPPGEAAEVVRFARSHAFVPRVLLIHGEDGQLSLSGDERREFDEVRRELGRRFTDARDYRSRLIERGRADFKCRAGSRYLYVDEAGVVRWCSQTRDHFGIPLADYTPRDLRRQFHTRKDCSAACTLGCVRKSSAPDQWRRQPYPMPPPS